MNLYSFKFLYNHDEGLSLLNKKNKKLVMLLSLTHTASRVPVEEPKQSLAIFDNNQKKVVFASLTKILKKVFMQQKTVRWPRILFYNMADASANNLYILIKNVRDIPQQTKFFGNLLREAAFQMGILFIF